MNFCSWRNEEKSAAVTLTKLYNETLITFKKSYKNVYCANVCVAVYYLGA